MRYFICYAIILLVCVFAQVQGDCQYEGETLTVGEHYRSCARITCTEDGKITGVGCGTWQCAEGKQIGYRELDHSKPYPDCCAGPICKED